MKTRDQFLTEAMGGCNCDEGVFRDSGYLCCVKCNQVIGNSMTPCIGTTNFSTWVGFGKLWEWSQTQEWYGNFIIQKVQYGIREIGSPDMMKEFVNPDKFADVVYKFLKDKEYDEYQKRMMSIILSIG